MEDKATSVGCQWFNKLIPCLGFVINVFVIIHFSKITV